MTFHVGQKVVCVAGFDRFTTMGDDFPRLGATYTVREVVPYPAYLVDECPCGLKLAEIVNPPRAFDDGFGERDFFAIGFRPVVERETDISIFQKMLTDIPETVE